MDSGLGPGPWRALPFFRFHNQIPRAIKAINAATPLIVPPTMAPVFLFLLSFAGASVSSSSASDVDDAVAESVVADAVEVASVVELSLDAEEVFELVFEAVEVDSVSVVEEGRVDVDLFVPRVVGSDSEVAVAVKTPETLVNCTADLPDAEFITLVARLDAEPHPY